MQDLCDKFSVQIITLLRAVYVLSGRLLQRLVFA